jgi:uncharacterized membrane protein
MNEFLGFAIISVVILAIAFIAYIGNGLLSGIVGLIKWHIFKSKKDDFDDFSDEDDEEL